MREEERRVKDHACPQRRAPCSGGKTRGWAAHSKTVRCSTLKASSTRCMFFVKNVFWKDVAVDTQSQMWGCCRQLIDTREGSSALRLYECNVLTRNEKHVPAQQQKTSDKGPRPAQCSQGACVRHIRSQVAVEHKHKDHTHTHKHTQKLSCKSPNVTWQGHFKAPPPSSSSSPSNASLPVHPFA